MYNYSINLSYREKDDTTYRKELLDCFHMNEYNDNIVKNIGTLYSTIKDEIGDIIAAIKPHHPLTPFNGVEDSDCFMFLFAWEYFFELHEFLIELHKKSKLIGEKKTVLLNKINAKNK